jgi:hypothetical protein
MKESRGQSGSRDGECREGGAVKEDVAIPPFFIYNAMKRMEERK